MVGPKSKHTHILSLFLSVKLEAKMEGWGPKEATRSWKRTAFFAYGL